MSQSADSAYDATGVDRSLIRWMLSLSPTERLAVAQDAIDVELTARRVDDADSEDPADPGRARR